MYQRISLMLLLLSVALPGSVHSVRAESDLPLWDNAVNRLLAAGLYGVGPVEGTSLSTRDGVKPFPTYAADKLLQDSRRITFSYEGSSGVLGFSAGYINTEGMDSGHPGAIFLGLDDYGQHLGTQDISLYWALDLLSTYQASDAVVFGIGGRTVLLNDASGPEQERVLSLLLNLPVSYKKYLTITPEVQWTRTLPTLNVPFADKGIADSAKPDDEFYGGVSISFSY